MVQVLTLQIELAAVLLAHTSGKVKRTGTTDIVAQQLIILLQKVFALYDLLITCTQCLERSVENLRNISTAKLTIKTILAYRV